LKPYGSVTPTPYPTLDNDHSCNGYDTGTGRVVLGYREYITKNSRMITFQFLEFPTLQVGPAVTYDSAYDQYTYPIQDAVLPNSTNKYVFPGIIASTHFQTSVITTGAIEAFSYTSPSPYKSPTLVKDYQNYIRPYYDIPFGANTVSSLLSYQYYIPSLYPAYGCSSINFDPNGSGIGTPTFTNTGFIKSITKQDSTTILFQRYDKSKTQRVGMFTTVTVNTPILWDATALYLYLPELLGNAVLVNGFPVTTSYFTNCEDYTSDRACILTMWDLPAQTLKQADVIGLGCEDNTILYDAINLNVTLFTIIT